MYCVSAIGNAHTPAPGTNANTKAHRYFAPSVASFASPTLAAATLSRTGTAHNGARLENGLRVFYATQGLATDFLKDRELTAARPRRDINCAVGKQGTPGSSVTVVDFRPHAARGAALAALFSSPLRTFSTSIHLTQGLRIRRTSLGLWVMITRLEKSRQTDLCAFTPLLWIYGPFPVLICPSNRLTSRSTDGEPNGVASTDDG